MEALRKLEEEQRMLESMQSRGIMSSSVNNHHDSDRFLAQFVLFLMQPCGELDMGMKCHLISEHMAKLSGDFLTEVSNWLHQQGPHKFLVNKPSTSDCKDKIHNGPWQYSSQNMAVVGLDAMERANSTLEDFCRSYFMFHDMDENMPQSIFRYLPVLSFTESYIYQLDSFNEKILQIPKSGVNILEGIPEKSNQGWTINLVEAFRTDPFRPLVLLLEHQELLTKRMTEELTQGKEYWALERKLCHALMSKEEISIEDAMRAIHMKSFDYRVLNLLLYQLTGEKINESHMEFLSVSEFLVEVSDDLFDYEDDVLENNFNILRMFVRIYGASTAPSMMAKLIAEAEEKYDNLFKTLDPELSLKYKRRCEEATREGGKMSGHAFGTWTMPHVIADEELYRSNLLNFDSSDHSKMNHAECRVVTAVGRWSRFGHA